MNRLNVLKVVATTFLLAALSSLTACGFVFTEEPPIASRCHDRQESCSPVCNTFCDGVGCWDECVEECWIEEAYCAEGAAPNKGKTTTTVEEETTEEIIECVGSKCSSGAKSCFNDGDCKSGKVCLAGVCAEKSSKRRGVAGLCQVCETSSDCFEPDAKCVQLNYNRVTKTGEKVCGRQCQMNNDCPIGFECVNISSDNGHAAQCIPQAQSIDNHLLRTCNSTPDLQCVKATDCSVGESCRNNRCVSQATSPSQPGRVECRFSSDCQMGQLCVDAKCVSPCPGGGLACHQQPPKP